MVEKQMKTIVALIALIIGITIGCCWTFYRYQPIKQAQEIEKLRADVKMCNSAWVKQFSREHKLIE